MAEEIPTAIAQSQGSSTKKRVWKKEKVWVEEYLHLLHSRQTLHLTINQLNQVPFILFILCTFQFSFSFSKFSLNTLHLILSTHCHRSSAFTASGKFTALPRFSSPSR